MTIDAIVSRLAMAFQFPEQDPNERSSAGVIPCAVMTTLVASLLVAARLYSRWGLLKTFGWEDGFILVALLFSYCDSAGMILQLKYGLGQHLQFVLPQLPAYTAAGLFTSLAYTLSLTFTKISILTLYIHVLTYKRASLFAKILLAIVVVSHVWIVITLLFAAVPLQAFWDRNIEAKFRMPSGAYWANSALNMATDLAIFSLPLPVIISLRAEKRQKIGLYAVFLLAFGVCIVSLVWVLLLVKMYKTAMKSFYNLSFEAVTIAVWSMIEVNAAIACACLTTLRPLIARLSPHCMASRGRSPGLSEDELNAEDRYRRPLTIGTQPKKPRVSRLGIFSSTSPNDDPICDLADGGDCHERTANDATPRRKYTSDVENQYEASSITQVDIIQPPSKASLRSAESLDSF